MADKSIVIIGAGIAGLTTGCYGQMNGYQTQIFEMHSQPGGLCTAWKRKGYTINGCLEWLVGSSPDSGYFHLWQEIGALQGKKIINMEQFCRIETSNGQILTVYTDVDRLEKHLKAIAPEDNSFIEEFTNAIRRFGVFDMPVDKAMELYGAMDNIKMLSKIRPFMGELQKWGKISMKDFALRFQNPFMREAWQMMWDPDFSSLFMIMSLAWMSRKNAGYVIGGSMELSRAIEKRYLALGGNITYKSKVKKILIENNQANGIILEDGTEIRADYVISAADGHSTIFDMLEGKYINDKIRNYYKQMPIFQPLVFVGLGINRSFEDIPQIISDLVFPLEKPIIIGNKEHKNLNVHIYNFDPTLAPDGKTVLTLMFTSNFAYWESLSQDKSRYLAEKERIADSIIAALDKRFPGLAAQVEMRDVATPMTFYRYTGNWQGSYEGWLITPRNMTLRMSKTLPELNNFFMVGQWVQPGGGLPSGLMTGCHVMQILCKLNRKKFCAVCPE